MIPYAIAAAVIAQALTLGGLWHYKTAGEKAAKTHAEAIKTMTADLGACKERNGNLVGEIDRQNRSISRAAEEQKARDADAAVALADARKVAEEAAKRGTRIVFRERVTKDACADAQSLFDDVVLGGAKR